MAVSQKSKWVILIVAAVAILALAAGCARHTSTNMKYQCPMHPTYISDKPGDCPICGMQLVPVGIKEEPSPKAAFVCPMHPEVTSDKPGKCPKCGMTLVPIKAGAPAPALETPSVIGEKRILYYRNPMDPSVTSSVPAKDSMGMDFVPVYADESAPGGGGIAGMADVSIGAIGIQLAGVQTAPAKFQRLQRVVRTVGVVKPDETLIRHVHTKVMGWIEKLFANYTGQMVTRGEPILTIYSPELVASQEEFLRARQEVSEVRTSDIPEIRQGSEDIVKAARHRLELFDVPQDLIDQLEKGGGVQRTVTLRSSASGYVTAKDVYEGKQIDPSMELFTITDLSRIWIDTDFYEFEARMIHIGQQASLTLPYDPSLKLAGRVSYIMPYLNAESRTLGVRFEFPNRDLKLKPSMYVDVELAIDGGEGVVIPDSAILDTGERQVVFVQTGEGRFMPREVTTGIRSNGMAMILAGVHADEHVVIRANFLLDSESRLRAALAGINTEAPPTQKSTQPNDQANH